MEAYKRVKLKVRQSAAGSSGDFADSLAVFAAPKRIGLKSHIRLVGSAGKIMFDYVIRRLNALSAGSEKPVGGLNLR